MVAGPLERFCSLSSSLAGPGSHAGLCCSSRAVPPHFSPITNVLAQYLAKVSCQILRIFLHVSQWFARCFVHHKVGRLLSVARTILLEKSFMDDCRGLSQLGFAITRLFYQTRKLPKTWLFSFLHMYFMRHLSIFHEAEASGAVYFHTLASIAGSSLALHSPKPTPSPAYPSN